ncbi:YitT family protein [Paenibacillus sp. F411]|uniref:YitT family protein n=1 Tax=Paenibacillus sp. F411 TaxID=2820239 RepID=UPI001AAF9F76|nr:YitT family protein [Paenibacillus sp. F411]MBO2943662.1 YitT family protein [Paenibacillus sp. F411]
MSWVKYCIMVLGSLFIAMGTNAFLVPSHVLDGGVIGIALIVNYLSGLPIGFVIIVCSVPMFLAAWLLNRDIFYNSLTGMLISSLMIDLLAPLQAWAPSYIGGSIAFNAAAGGAFIGAGLGLMLRFETSTGGTDLLAHFLTRYVPLNVGIIILIMDVAIIGAGGVLLSGGTFVQSLVTILAGALATGLCTLRKQVYK